MTMSHYGSALALSLLLAACGGNQDVGPENRQGADAGAAMSQAGQVYSAAGEVTAITGDRVTISHGPVAGLGWPAMTMSFGAGSPEMVEGLSVGDRVSFEFHQDNGAYTLTSLTKGG